MGSEEGSGDFALGGFDFLVVEEADGGVAPDEKVAVVLGCLHVCE